MSTTETKVKERPILFSGSMVRAIIEGRKTQTRRVIKPKHEFFVDDGHDGINRVYYPCYVTGEPEPQEILCPYGSVGERLWVRETWAVVPKVSDDGPKHKAKGDGTGATWRADWNGNPSGFPWKPSIHMPRWASRITLEVTGVRIERLNDIDLADCIAEGIEWKYRDDKTTHWRDYSGLDVSCTTSAYFSYQTLWESINGPLSWSLNPWVWVVEFKRIENL